MAEIFSGRTRSDVYAHPSAVDSAGAASVLLSAVADVGEVFGGREAEAGEYYLQQCADASEAGYTGYCGNIAADAVASHYTAYAESLGAGIEWHMNLPAELPMNESEYCAVLGNLVENALKAVKNLPEERRRVKVISSLLSDAIIGLSVENPFCGSVVLGRNGLPRSDGEEHGIGLMSVQNTVKRHLREIP